MLDFSLMLQVKLPVNRIQPESDKFAVGVEKEATNALKLNDKIILTFHLQYCNIGLTSLKHSGTDDINQLAMILTCVPLRIHCRPLRHPTLMKRMIHQSEPKLSNSHSLPVSSRDGKLL